MTVPSSKPEHLRRSRYHRVPEPPVVALTAVRLLLLTWLAVCGVGSSKQLARVAGRSQLAINRDLRMLFDAGLIDAIPVVKAALLDPDQEATPAMLYGSTPGIFRLTRKGLQALLRLRPDVTAVPIPSFTPTSLLLAHRLFVNDIRLFFTVCAWKCQDQQLLDWREGKDAEVILGGSKSSILRPDSYLLYQIDTRLLSAYIEADRSTEAAAKWECKLVRYGALFSGNRIKEATGYANARLLIVTLSAARRDALAAVIKKHAPPHLVERIWLAERSVLHTDTLYAPLWRQVRSAELKPLIPALPRQQASGGR